MEETRYMISEAAKQIEVEDHVLRYWEDELGLPISRNELRHRYYTNADIELLKTVKYLKEQGFQLKAIKMLMPNFNRLDSLDPHDMDRLKDELNRKVLEMWDGDKKSENQNDETSLVTNEQEHEVKEDSEEKLTQFKKIMHNIVTSALKENNSSLSNDIGIKVTDGVVKEMNYLMRVQEEKEEERYRKFDATIRDYQKNRMMTAATLEGKSRKKSKFFKKNKVYI